MKAIFYFIVIVSFFSFSASKISMENLTLNNSKEKVLLANIQNKIRVSGISASTEFELTSKYCHVNRYEEDKMLFKIMPKSFTNKKDTLKIVTGGQIVAQFIYKIDSLPKFKVGIEGIPNKSDVTVDQLKKNHALIVKQQNSNYCNCNYEVKSYKIVYVTPTVTKTEIVTNKGMVEQAWKVVGSLNKGSTVMVNSIILNSEKCGNASAPSLSFTIK